MIDNKFEKSNNLRISTKNVRKKSYWNFEEELDLHEKYSPTKKVSNIA